MLPANDAMAKLGRASGRPAGGIGLTPGRDNNGGFPAPPYLQHRPGGEPAVSQGATASGDTVKPSDQQPGGVVQNPNPSSNKTPMAAGAPTPQPAPPSAPLPASDGQTPQPEGMAQVIGGVLNSGFNPSDPRNSPGSMGGAPTALGGFSHAAPTPAAQPANQYSLSNIGGQIEGQLANPSAFNADVVKQAYDYMKGDLEKSRDQGLAGADVDAASRGMYYGTPGIQSRERVTTDYNRGLGDLASKLAIAQAQTYGQDRQNAMNNAFTFLGQANQQDMQDEQLAALAAELGMSGAPTYGTALGVPMPNVGGGQLDPNALASLGGLLAGKGSSKKKQAPPAAEDNTNNVG